MLDPLNLCDRIIGQMISYCIEISLVRETLHVLITRFIIIIYPKHTLEVLSESEFLKSSNVLEF